MRRILAMAGGAAAVSAIGWLMHRTFRPDAAAADPAALIPPGLRESAIGVGLLLLGAWFIGRLLQALHLPKITGFLLFGVAIGPSALEIITADQLEYLALVNGLAISLIALLAGGEIDLGFIRPMLRKIAAILSVQAVCVMTAVTLAGLVVLQRIGGDAAPTGMHLVLLAMAIGVVGTACSPAVVIAMVTDMERRSRFAQTVLAMVVCMDMLLVVLFTVVLAGAQAAGASAGAAAEAADHALRAAAGLTHTIMNAASTTDQAPAAAVSPWLIADLAKHLVGSILLGAVIGVAMSWYTHARRPNLAILLPLLCFAIAIICEHLHLETLLTSLTAGILMRNVWPRETTPVFETLERLCLPVYCIFFAVAGAKVNLDVLAHNWHWALLLAGVRAASMIGSVSAGARVAKLDPNDRRWLWTAFISQAGVALAFAQILSRASAGTPYGPALYDLLVAMIAINELVGPIVFKLGLSKTMDDIGPGPAQESG